MQSISIDKDIQQQIQESNLNIPIELSDDLFNDIKKDWVLLKLSIPFSLREWLDFNKKQNNISYSKFIVNSMRCNIKSKDIFIKIIKGISLSSHDLEFIQSFVNNEK